MELGVGVNNPRGFRVADQQMGASSSYSLFYSAYRGRLNIQSRGPWKDAWCSSRLDSSPYFEIDFGKMSRRHL